MYSNTEFNHDKKTIISLIDNHMASKQREDMKVAKKYYDGENVTINAVKKMICVASESGSYTNRENPFVSNYHIADKFTEDMVNQKVFTLLDKSPRVEGVSDQTNKATKNILDYALQKMGVEASICGVAYAYVEYGQKLTYKVFNTIDCIGFFDDTTEELTQLIRYWKSKHKTVNGKDISYIEVYEKDMYTLYKRYESEFEVLKQNSYMTQIVGNSISKTEVAKNWESGLPIVVMKNNSNMRADFDNAIRSQIDSIDIVISDFANNLADFQEVFWILKGLNEVTAQEAGEFMQAIKNTNKASLPEGADADMKQVDIPFQARKEFATAIEKKLIKNGGVIDTEMVLTGGLTQVAIKTASQRLMLRVSRFEYEVYNTALKMLEFAREFTGDTSAEEIVVTFFKSYISNDTEIISNLVMSLGQLSHKTFLELHPYVEDVEEEEKRIAEEGASKYSVSLPPEPTE